MDENGVSGGVWEREMGERGMGGGTGGSEVQVGMVIKKGRHVATDRGVEADPVGPTRSFALLCRWPASRAVQEAANHTTRH